jgi:predicted nucleic acid-binding protein
MLVFDANIIIRAVLGSQVLAYLRKYAERVEFRAPDTAFEEARTRLPRILERRKMPLPTAMTLLDQLAGLVQVVEPDRYRSFEEVARLRIEKRNEDDWPVVAAALALDCAIWTEDNDFFGCGVATWTTDRVELFLATAKAREQ